MQGDFDAVAIYRDALPEGDELKFHHVCHIVDDWAALEAHIAANPFPVVLKGGTPGKLQFCYVDTRPWLGHYTEYMWVAMRSAGASWAGDDRQGNSMAPGPSSQAVPKGWARALADRLAAAGIHIVLLARIPGEDGGAGGRSSRRTWRGSACACLST